MLKRFKRANIGGGNAKSVVNIIAAHLPLYSFIKLDHNKRDKKAEIRQKSFKENSEHPHSLKIGASNNPSRRLSPDLISY